MLFIVPGRCLSICCLLYHSCCSLYVCCTTSPSLHVIGSSVLEEFCHSCITRRLNFNPPYQSHTHTSVNFPRKFPYPQQHRHTILPFPFHRTLNGWYMWSRKKHASVDTKSTILTMHEINFTAAKLH